MSDRACNTRDVVASDVWILDAMVVNMIVFNFLWSSVKGHVQVQAVEEIQGQGSGWDLGRWWWEILVFRLMFQIDRLITLNMYIVHNNSGRVQLIFNNKLMD